MQRAVAIVDFNDKDPDSSLKLITKPIPNAEPGHVVVRITLRPVNPTDVVGIRTGRAARGVEGPAIPGSEGFGIVHAVSNLDTSLLYRSVPTTVSPKSCSLVHKWDLSL